MVARARLVPRPVRDEAPEARARGEASTNYTKAPLFLGVPERIASVVPDVRIVYVVRDPLERIVSQYRHALRAGGSDGRSSGRSSTIRSTCRSARMRRSCAATTTTSPPIRCWWSRPKTCASTASQPWPRCSVSSASIQRCHAMRWPTSTTPHRRSCRGGGLGRSCTGCPVVPRSGGSCRHRSATRTAGPRRSTTLIGLRLTDATRGRVLDRLRPEVADLRAMVGVPVDGWGLLG